MQYRFYFRPRRTRQPLVLFTHHRARGFSLHSPLSIAVWFMANFPKTKKPRTQASRGFLRVGKRASVASPTKRIEVAQEVGVFEHEGKRFYGARTAGDDKITLCVPSDSGILIKTTSQVAPIGEVKFSIISSPVIEEGRVERFDMRPEFTIDEKMITVMDKKRPVDYQDVTVSGVASDFLEDRDGEYVAEGAFRKSLTDFKRNPVMLIDHQNGVRNLAGSYSRITETSKGLLVEGKISNAPGLCDVRFLIAEKHLKAFSIGGMMKFGSSDNRKIEEVKLFEISLVAIPANPRALFQGKGLDLATAKKAFNI